MADERLKVLIADDDFRVAMLIKILIQWDELNLECVGVVNNGEEAFKILCSKQPNILITDIQMPRINGLDLIAMAKDKDKDIKFIVVSGYKDFEYAHRALQYDVTSYLLKPIDETELNDTIRKICKEFSAENNKKEKEEVYKKVVFASRQIIKKDILNNIIDNGRFPPPNKIYEDYGLELDASVYSGIVIKLDYLDFNKINTKQDRITIDKVINIAESTFKALVKEALICDKEGLYVYCLLNYDPPNSKDVKNSINKMLTELQQYLLGFEQYKVTIGVGPEKIDYKQIFFSIQDAKRAVENRIITGTDRLIYAKSLFVNKPDFVFNYLNGFKDVYLSSINSYNVEMLQGCINQIFDGLLKMYALDYSCYYELAKQLIVLFFEQTEMQNEEGQKLEQRLLGLYQHCYTFYQLKNLLRQYLGEYLNIYLELLQMRSKKPIRQAKQYIDEHKSEKIILEDIADIVKLNPVYFSVLFKKETGLNFSAYLANVRMDTAKDMLVNSNDTIAAIADKVGYRDVRYFSRLFAKTFGVKPAVYRKLYS